MIRINSEGTLWGGAARGGMISSSWLGREAFWQRSISEARAAVWAASREGGVSKLRSYYDEQDFFSNPEVGTVVAFPCAPVAATPLGLMGFMIRHPR